MPGAASVCIPRERMRRRRGFRALLFSEGRSSPISGSSSPSIILGVVASIGVNGTHFASDPATESAGERGLKLVSGVSGSCPIPCWYRLRLRICENSQKNVWVYAQCLHFGELDAEQDVRKGEIKVSRALTVPEKLLILKV
jgi:hypothetical protein